MADEKKINKEETEKQPKAEEKKTAKEKKQPLEKEKLETLIKEAEDKYVYLAAEYDNYRKRTAREKETMYSSGVADTLEALLGFIDDFERAIAAPCSDEAYKKGIDMVGKKLSEFMEKQGIEEIETDGQFDPEIHNAVMHEESEELPENTIAQVFSKGYKVKGKVVRPAMVKVAN